MKVYTVTGTAASKGRHSINRRFGLVAVALAAVVLAALLTSLTLASAAAPVEPRSGQRIDMKVLLVGDSGTEPTFEAWKAQLKREGVPYDAVVASTDAEITDAKLADYMQNRAS
jgi:ABC-type sugar transport system substrate-binding protein